MSDTTHGAEGTESASLIPSIALAAAIVLIGLIIVGAAIP